jgi:hypothetical protein
MKIIVKKKGDKKRHLLKDITVDEVSSVGRGANQGAAVTLLKTADGGMQTFVDAMRAQEVNRNVLEEAWNMHYAFRESVESIVSDDSITDKKAAILAQLTPLVTALATMIDGSDVLDDISKAFKTEQGNEFPAGDYAYVPKPDKPNTWKLRLTSEPGGEPDPRIVGMAVAALGEGFRGNKVQIPEEDRKKVVARVRAAWLRANTDKGEKDLPEVIKKSKTEGENMDKEIKKLQKSNDELQAKLAESEFQASLNDAEKAHYAKLNKEDADAFEKMDADARKSVVDAAIAKAAADDEVISIDGEAIKKSEVGPGVFAFMKSQQVKADAAIAKAEKLEADAIAKGLEIEAEEMFPHLAGTKVEKAAMLKGIRALPADQQEAQIKMLKAADASMAKGMKEVGQAGQADAGSSDEKLNKMAKELSEKDSISIEKAYSKVLDTKEGMDLYKETISGK